MTVTVYVERAVSVVGYVERETAQTCHVDQTVVECVQITRTQGIEVEL